MVEYQHRRDAAGDEACRSPRSPPSSGSASRHEARRRALRAHALAAVACCSPCGRASRPPRRRARRRPAVRDALGLRPRHAREGGDRPRARATRDDPETLAWVLRDARAAWPSACATSRPRASSCAIVHYEALRAGLDPRLVLGVIDVESGFRKYAGLDGGRARLHAGDAVLGARDRHARAEPLPPAHQPALRLRDPAPLPARSRTATSTTRSAATTAASAGPSIRSASWRRCARAGPRRLALRLRGGGDRFLERLARDGARPIPGALARGIEDHRRGQSLHLAELLLGACRPRAPADRRGPTFFANCCVFASSSTSSAMPITTARAGAFAALELRDLRDLLDAGRAPRGPEVHDHPLAAVVGEPVALALGIGDVEGEAPARAPRGRGRATRQRAWKCLSFSNASGSSILGRAQRSRGGRMGPRRQNPFKIKD